MAELRIAYKPDDQWMGKITVRVLSDQFSGEGSAWINATDVGDFANALGRYPLPSDEPAVIFGGLGGSVDGRRPPQILVRVTVKPQGPRGQITVCAELQTEVQKDEDEDLHQSVVARFRTEYGLLQRFARSLENVAAGQVAEATLAGAG